VVVDAIQRVPASPGSIHRLTAGELETGCAAASSHGLGIPDAIRLGRVLERLPRQVVILAVEGADTGPGAGLSDAVAAAVPHAVAAVMAELKLTRSLDNPEDAAPHRKRQSQRGRGG
jgi:hydrogenase maturation protease